MPHITESHSRSKTGTNGKHIHDYLLLDYNNRAVFLTICKLFLYWKLCFAYPTCVWPWSGRSWCEEYLYRMLHVITEVMGLIAEQWRNCSRRQLKSTAQECGRQSDGSSRTHINLYIALCSNNVHCWSYHLLFSNHILYYHVANLRPRSKSRSQTMVMAITLSCNSITLSLNEAPYWQNMSLKQNS